MSSLTRHVTTAVGAWRRFATAAAPSSSSPEPLTHYKITLRRSAISLPLAFKATLVSLGIHRRMQTVYHPHSPECAGKILKVKELVEVDNVPASRVRTKTEQRHERKARRGYVVVNSKLEYDEFSS
jgi:large subunit ribosomal protein L30